LNFAVQRTIDRIIFLRMCEDRGVENYGQLQALLNGKNTYKRLQYIYISTTSPTTGTIRAFFTSNQKKTEPKHRTN
jgi:hypothetical protein